MSLPGSNPLEEVHALFKELPARQGQARYELVYAVLMHPTSQERLAGACGCVLGRLAGRSDLRADLMQEATCRLAGRLLSHNLSYSDRGPEKFAGWLFRLWLTTCLDAWKDCHPLWLGEVGLERQHELEQIAARPQFSAARHCVVELIFACHDRKLRRILIDWSSERTIRESAAKRGLSRSEVVRLRRRLAESIRTAEPPQS